MRKRKKLLSTLVAAVMILTLLTGCGEASPSASTTPAIQSSSVTPAASEASGNGEFQYPTTPIEFTCMWMYDWWVPTTPLKWGEDEVTKYIQERFNVKINQVGADGDPRQKLNVLIASESLPEVIVLDRSSDWKKTIKAGALIPIDDYVTKYPAYKQKISEETMNAYRQDGKLYGMLNWATSKDHPMGNGGYSINEKLYKELGSPPLNTLDDLYSYLKLIKDSGKTMDGQPIVPFQGDTRVGDPMDKFIFRSAFGDFNAGLNPHFLSEVNNELTYFMKDPKWVETLLFINKLVREDLINPDVFIEKTDQMEEKLANGRVGVFCSGADMVDPVARGRMAWRAKDPTGDYKAIEPFTANGVNVSDVWTSSFSTLGWNVMCITKSARDPERIYAFYDWVLSDEGQLITFNGPKGEIWDELDEKGYPIFTKSRYELPIEEQYRIGFEFNTNPGFADFVDFAKVAGDNRLPPEKRDWVIQAQSNITWKHSIDNTEFEDISPDPSSKEGVIEEMVREISNTQFTKIALAKSEDLARSYIEETIKKVYDAGFGSIEKFKNEKWKENVARMSGK